MPTKNAITMALLLAAACAPADEAPEVVVTDTTATATAPAAPTRATAELRDSAGAVVGTAVLQEGPRGVEIALRTTGLPDGTHGFHIHTTGVCTPPDFASAGGHFNPTSAQHGAANPQGPHAGDMPNVVLSSTDTAAVQTVNATVTLGAGPTSLFDADGSALVIHADADDNMTDPAGNAGARIACGVITPAE